MSQRFSDAELAAEWWRAANDWNAELYGFATGDEPRWQRGDNSEERFDNADERLDTIERFATLPHAHEPEPKTVYVYDESGRCIGNFPKPDDNWTE